ncbi:glycosyltransferase family 4 protein [Leptospira sp. 96542]|nr:glycosyltransferase family 4 protein [Leptospira sp. 96542]
MNVHQFSAGFQLGDAISQEMLELKRLLSLQGYKGEIYSGNVSAIDSKFAEKITKANINTNDVLIYHHSIHTEVLEFLLKLPNKKILIYHNVTPEHFFTPYDLKFSFLLRQGRDDLKIIRDHFDYAFAVSEFNLDELKENHFRNPQLLPLHINFKKWIHLKPQLKQKLNPFPNFLFVGRIAPNKRQDDLIRLARTYKSIYGNQFIIRMIGFCNPDQKSYLDELNFMIQHLDLADEVKIIPYVDESMLTKYYLESDFFISMSEHEGFCVPLLEAMNFELPVIAYNAGAIKETLDDSGILLLNKNFEQISRFLHELFLDSNMKNKIILKQEERLSKYLANSNIENLVEVLKN